MHKEALLEALLFSKGSCRKDTLASDLELSEAEVDALVQQLQHNLAAQGRGLTVVTNGDEVMLGTHPDAATFVEKIRKAELSGPLTKQSLETIAIIAYADQASKPFIDALRGVNTHVTLRNLIERGLIERYTDPNDKRVFRYRLTTDCLRYLGIHSQEELPGFNATRQALDDRQFTPSDAPVGNAPAETRV